MQVRSERNKAWFKPNLRTHMKGLILLVQCCIYLLLTILPKTPPKCMDKCNANQIRLFICRWEIVRVSLGQLHTFYLSSPCPHPKMAIRVEMLKTMQAAAANLEAASHGSALVRLNVLRNASGHTYQR